MEQRAGRKEAKETDARAPPWPLLATGPSYDCAANQMLSPYELQLLEWMAGLERAEGKKKKKKIDFFVEENKYGDMERDPSANRRGLRFDRAAGSQVAVSVPRN